MSDDRQPNAAQQRRLIASQALTFLGAMVSVGGSLAILRTGERSLLFVLMIPLGLMMWVAGFYLRPRVGGDEEQ